MVSCTCVSIKYIRVFSVSLIFQDFSNDDKVDEPEEYLPESSKSDSKSEFASVSSLVNRSSTESGIASESYTPNSDTSRQSRYSDSNSLVSGHYNTSRRIHRCARLVERCRKRRVHHRKRIYIDRKWKYSDMANYSLSSSDSSSGSALFLLVDCHSEPFKR